MQGGLRRGAYGTVLLGKACYGRAWCIGEGMQEGRALIQQGAWRLATTYRHCEAEKGGGRRAGGRTDGGGGGGGPEAGDQREAVFVKASEDT
jgi:hypothetical protein